MTTTTHPDTITVTHTLHRIDALSPEAKRKAVDAERRRIERNPPDWIGEDAAHAAREAVQRGYEAVAAMDPDACPLTGTCYDADMIAAARRHLANFGPEDGPEDPGDRLNGTPYGRRAAWEIRCHRIAEDAAQADYEYATSDAGILESHAMEDAWFHPDGTEWNGPEPEVEL